MMKEVLGIKPKSVADVLQEMKGERRMREVEVEMAIGEVVIEVGDRAFA